MALKTYSPATPGQRQLVLVDRSGLHKGGPVKALTEGQTRNAGRNNTGRITVRFRGGGHKQAYRKIDFRRAKLDVPATVERLEYDPNRTAFIALIKYKDGELAYILAPQRLAVGDSVIAGASVDVKPGNAMPVGAIPVGTIVHNVETKPGRGGALARAAGTYAMVAGRDQGYVLLKLKSGETRMVNAACMASIGAVSNPDHVNEVIGKAGRARWMGMRPVSRGIARNPVDHPNGGGGGKKKGGGGRQHLKSPWGQLAKGFPTRRRSKPSNASIIVHHNGRKPRGQK